MRNYSVVWLSVRRRIDVDYLPMSYWDGIISCDSYRIPRDAKMDGI